MIASSEPETHEMPSNYTRVKGHNQLVNSMKLSKEVNNWCHFRIKIWTFSFW